MIDRLFTHCVLRPSDVPPAHEGMRVVGVFNPGAAVVNGEVVLLARVVEQPIEMSETHEPSPRIDEDGQLVIDWLAKDEQDLSDARVCVSKIDGKFRLRFISHLRVLRLKDGKIADVQGDPNCLGASILPQGEYEEYGIEDPRITKIGGTFYITYVGASRHGVVTALMSTTDFQRFERHGNIFCPDNKDVVLFPEKIAGDYVAIHRPMPSMALSQPKMWIARSPDLFHWGAHEQLLGGNEPWQADKVGGGTPPIRTDKGWFTLYHGTDRKHHETGAGVYTSATLMLDLNNPSKILGHSAGPFMKPEEDFETKGFVDNVIFPTAMAELGDQLLVYYGAADENLGVVGFDREALIATAANA